jgi:DNA-binding transcriptional ArsR family regulator
LDLFENRPDSVIGGRPGSIRSGAAQQFPVLRTLSNTPVGFFQAEAINKYKFMITYRNYDSPSNELGSVLNAIAHPTRRGILELLTEQELSVARIAEQFSVSRPAVVKHLRVLRFANLICVRRRGRERIHCLNRKPLASVEAWLLFASSGRKIPRFACASLSGSISSVC